MTDDRTIQQRIVLAIAYLTRKHGYAPTVRDLMVETEVSSTSVVTYHLEQLREAGMVTWEPRVARTIRLVKAS